jgi:hypothetical protein
VTTSGSVCRMTLGCGRTTIEVKSGKIWAGKKMIINDILKSYFKSINVIRSITFYTHLLYQTKTIFQFRVLNTILNFIIIKYNYFVLKYSSLYSKTSRV